MWFEPFKPTADDTRPCSWSALCSPVRTALCQGSGTQILPEPVFKFWFPAITERTPVGFSGEFAGTQLGLPLQTYLQSFQILAGIRGYWAKKNERKSLADPLFCSKTIQYPDMKYKTCPSIFAIFKSAPQTLPNGLKLQLLIYKEAKAGDEGWGRGNEAT